MPRLSSLLSALPDFGIAAVALVTWINPQLLGEEYVGYFLTLMLLEFIVVHSAAFLGTVAFSDKPRGQRALQTVGLAGFYTVFVGGFALASQAWWPLLGFWGLIVNRLLGILVGAAPTGEEKLYAGRSWAAGAVCYLGGVFVTLFLPLPMLGVRQGMLGAVGQDSSGVWVDEPQRVIVFAALYFAGIGLSTLQDHRWLSGGVQGPVTPGRRP